MAARGDTKRYFPALGGIYDWVSRLGLSAPPCHSGLNATPARMAKVHEWPVRRRRHHPCPPRHRTRVAIRQLYHVPRIGRRNLHHNRLSHPAFCSVCLIEMLFITFKVQVPNGWFFSAQGGGAEFTVMWAAFFSSY